MTKSVIILLTVVAVCQWVIIDCRSLNYLKNSKNEKQFVCGHEIQPGGKCNFYVELRHPIIRSIFPGPPGINCKTLCKNNEAPPVCGDCDVTIGG